MKHEEIDVIIPVYRPDEKLHRLLLSLERQTVKPSRILLVNTERSLFDEACLTGTEHVEVIHIRKSEFDHGGTRHMAAEMLQGAFLLFLTQDAVPADDRLVEQLYAAFDTEKGANPAYPVAAAYARQLPMPDCQVIERYTRSFNYGETSRIKTAEDLPKLGIKTFFCSDVCAMYRRSVYEALGGFVRRTIFNEDMIFAGKLIQNGYAVAYCAKAQVYHSHNYSGLQQFHRNFDLGVSQAEHPEIFQMARSESEGIRMVKQTAAYLCRNKKAYLLPKLIWQSGWKFLGYQLGKRYQKLPECVIRRCTMSPGYWEHQNESDKQ